jgi:transposase
LFTSGRYEHAGFQLSVIQRLLPSNPRAVARANDRQRLDGILQVPPSGAPWRDLPIKFLLVPAQVVDRLGAVALPSALGEGDTHLGDKPCDDHWLCRRIEAQDVALNRSDKSNHQENLRSFNALYKNAAALSATSTGPTISAASPPTSKCIPQNYFAMIELASARISIRQNKTRPSTNQQSTQ